MDSPRVLFVVNEDTSLSGPLELSAYLAKLDVELHIAVYYVDERSDYYAEGRAAADLPAGATVHRIGARRASDPGAAWRLFRLIRTIEPDVVHVHHTISSAVASLSARIARVPLVVRTEHNDHRRTGSVQTALNAVSLACSNRVICNSQSTMDSFYWWENLLARRKAVTIYNGISVERVHEQAAMGASKLREALGVDPDTVVIGSLGRLIEQKDYATLVRAFSLLDSGSTSTMCIVVGGGRLEGALRELSSSLGLDSRVEFVGNLPRDEAYRYLGIFDVFVVASIWEGFCNAAVEAMAAGVPLVCTDIGTLREVVGPAGRYFTPGSADELASVLAELSGWDPAQRRHLGEQGRQWVRSRYGIAGTASSYRRLYDEALDGRRARA